MSAPRHAGVVLIPAVGFDVVQSRLPGHGSPWPPVAELRRGCAWAFAGVGRPEPARPRRCSTICLGAAGRDRRANTRVPLAWKTREVPLAAQTMSAVTIPWGVRPISCVLLDRHHRQYRGLHRSRRGGFVCCAAGDGCCRCCGSGHAAAMLSRSKPHRAAAPRPASTPGRASFWTTSKTTRARAIERHADAPCLPTI